jgi:plastocyanin
VAITINEGSVIGRLRRLADDCPVSENDETELETELKDGMRHVTKRRRALLVTTTLGVAAASALAGAPAMAHASAPPRAHLAPERVTLVARPGSRMGPDHKMHDAYTYTTIRARAGQQVIVTVYNHDNTPHSFVAPALKLHVTMPASTRAGAPSVTTFTFTVDKAGSYHWLCAMPCDDWAMARDGYMAGTIVIARG